MAKANRKFRFLSLLLRWSILFFSVIVLVSYLSPILSPEKYWWIALLGLTYPFLVFILFILLALSFIFRWKTRWWLMVVFIIGLPIHGRFFAWNMPQNKDDKALKLMSYNVRLFDVYNWIQDKKPEETRDEILGYIKNESPDVFCVQEFYSDRSSNPFINSEKIVETGNFTDYHQQLVIETIKKDFGIAIFTKLPVLERGVVGDKSPSIFCIYVDVLYEQDTVRIYNTHLRSVRFQLEDYKFFNESPLDFDGQTNGLKSIIKKLKNAYPARVEQANAILKHALESNREVIICGDFNDTPASYVYNLFYNQFNDAFKESAFGFGRTYVGKVPAGRIDYIFHSSKLVVENFGIQKQVLSDHLAIKAYFSVN